MAEISGLPSDLDAWEGRMGIRKDEVEEINLMMDEGDEDVTQILCGFDGDGSMQKDSEAALLAEAAVEEERLEALVGMLHGDPLKDLPDAEEGGAIVAIAKGTTLGIDTFMNQYGIVTSKEKNKDWVLGLPTWLQWVGTVWEEAVALATHEDEALSGEHSEGGQKVRVRILSMGSTDGKAPEGSVQIVWRMFRTACKYINKTAFFSNFFNTLIVINTIYMGFEVDGNWQGPATEVFDQIFVTLFLCEIVIRIAATDTFTTGNVFLYFDSAIVFVSVLDMWVLPWMMEADGSKLRLLQVFRICRLVRLARLLRLIKALEPLRLMERSLRRGVNHFLSIMVLLAAILYAASILISLQINQSKMESIYADQPTNYCGSVLRLMVYLFEAMLSGYDWADRLVNPLLGDSSTRGVGMFLIGLLFCLKIALVNLITSSMVENYFKTKRLEATEVEQDELYRAIDVAGLEALLQDADSTMDGKISWSEFVKFGRTNEKGPQFLRMLGILDETKSEEESMEQLLDMRKIFQALDLAGEECIPIQVFVLGYVKLKGAKKNLDGLVMDVLLKKVMLEVRSQDNLIYPMERHITEIDTLMCDRVRDLQDIQLDLEEMVSPIEERLSSLEATFARLAESLKDPDENTQVVPDARASISSMSMHAEMEELKKVAKAFCRSKGMDAEHTMSANAKLLPASALLKHS